MTNIKSETLRAMQIHPTDTPYTYQYLVHEHADSVYKFCRGLTYSKEDAEDLFQETFLHVFTQMHKAQRFDKPSAFLFSTAVFIWKSWKRKYARRDHIAPSARQNENMPSETNTEDSYIKQEEIREVRALAAALPDKFKIPVMS